MAELPAVLILGCSGSGKSTIVNQWKLLCSDGRSRAAKPKAKGDGSKAEHGLQFAVTPNTGYERDTLHYANRAFVVMEVGGGMKNTWHSYFQRANAIIYVLDKANRRQIAAVAFDLATLLTSPKLARVPVMFVLNKCDLPTAMTRTELQSLLRFDDILCSAPQIAYLFPRVPPPRAPAGPQTATAGGLPGQSGAVSTGHAHGHGHAHAHAHGKDGAAAGPHARHASWSQPGGRDSGQHHHHHGAAAASGAAGAHGAAARDSTTVYALLPPVPAAATLSSALPYQPFSVSIAPASTSSIIVAANAAALIAGNVPGSPAAASTAVGGSHSPPMGASGAHAITIDRTGSKHTADLKLGLAGVSGAASGVLPGAKAVNVSGAEPKSPKGKGSGYDFGVPASAGAGAAAAAGPASGGGAGTTRVGGVSGPPKPVLKFPTGGGPGSPVMGASGSPVTVAAVHASVASPLGAAAAAAAGIAGGSPPRAIGAAGSAADLALSLAGVATNPSTGAHAHSSSLQLTARDAAAALSKGPVLPPTLPVFETSGTTRAGVSALLDYVSYLLYALPPPPTTHAGPASLLSGRGAAPPDLLSAGGGANKAHKQAH